MNDEDCNDEDLYECVQKKRSFVAGGRFCELDFAVHGHGHRAWESQAAVTLLGACHNSQVSAMLIEKEIRHLELFERHYGSYKVGLTSCR